jgi:hypothetical protein
MLMLYLLLVLQLLLPDRPLGMGIPTAGLCMFRRKDPVDALQAALVSILESF